MAEEYIARVLGPNGDISIVGPHYDQVLLLEEANRVNRKSHDPVEALHSIIDVFELTDPIGTTSGAELEQMFLRTV